MNFSSDLVSTLNKNISDIVLWNDFWFAGFSKCDSGSIACWLNDTWETDGNMLIFWIYKYIFAIDSNTIFLLHIHIILHYNDLYSTVYRYFNVVLTMNM